VTIKIALNAVKLPKFEAVNGKSWSPRTMVVKDQRQRSRLTWYCTCTLWIGKSGSGISNMWRKFVPYAYVTWYGACAVAANALSVVSYGRCQNL